LLNAALYLAFASAVAILFSIAAYNILFAASLVALLLSKAPLRVPRIWLPLSLFLAATLASLAFSGDAHAGLPQVWKIYVYSMLMVAFSLFRDLKVIRRLFLCWAGVGALVGLRGIVQFIDKFAEARALGRNFLEYYEPERISGFMSHWMTFSGQIMIVLLMLMACLFWCPSIRKNGLWLCVLGFGALSLVLVLTFTRSIWVATFFGGLYLVWFWKRWLVALAPVALLVAYLAGPASIRTRAQSIFHASDNQIRLIMWRTGIRMVEAHPLLGVGPEQVRIQFMNYLPEDTPRPLPTGYLGHLHNFYLQYAAERGVPALLALLWMLGMMLADFWRALRRLPQGPGDRRFILHGAIAVILATMIAGFFEHNLNDTEVLVMFLVVASCGYIAVEDNPGHV